MMSAKQIATAAILSGFLIACAPQKRGCGTENYRHKFTVEKIVPVKPGDTLVALRNKWGDKLVFRYECLPDSIAVGKSVIL